MPVRAAQVMAGDRLAYDGIEVTVTAAVPGSFHIRGQYGPGVAIDYEAGTRRGRIFRRDSDVLHRLAAPESQP